ncbi:hypothetical protein POM88_034660 [Heracleum sosnowskyi]|uniref:Uncharacterized protein n=1 Tax=Heracleum sosnowskyi TaxID=360622 RepID=A0AAD8MDT4_9APIA|nr:hypothetical protein POM88_034660 [Heracleum sosnowskyi]
MSSSVTLVQFAVFNNSVKPPDLKIHVSPKPRFFKSLHRACQNCFGFSSLGAKSCAASFSSFSFDIKNTGEYENKAGLEQNEALNIGGSDIGFGSGLGSGGDQGNGGGRRTGTNDGSGGVGGSADWEKVKGCCWWLLDTWNYHYQLAHPSSSSALLFSRFVMPIVEEIVGNGAQDLEGLLMRLLMAICYPMFVAIPLVLSGIGAAVEQMLLLFAAGVLGFVLVALFLFAYVVATMLLQF